MDISLKKSFFMGKKRILSKVKHSNQGITYLHNQSQEGNQRDRDTAQWLAQDAEFNSQYGNKKEREGNQSQRL